MRKVILLTAMPKESVWSSSIYVNGGGLLSSKISFSRILLLFVCCIVCNNVFAQDAWQTIQDFESLTSNDVKACLVGGAVSQDNKAAALIIENVENHGKVGEFQMRESYQGNHGIVFSVDLGTKSLSQYSDIRFDIHYLSDECKQKQVTVAVRERGSSGEFTGLANKQNENTVSTTTWQTYTFNNFSSAGKNYTDFEIFISLGGQQPILSYQIDNIQLYGPAIGSSAVDISETVDNSTTLQSGVTAVNLTRSLTANMWNTICLPFAPSSDQAKTIFGKDAKFAEFSSVSNGVMQFTSVDVKDLHAGTPYLVLPSQDKTTESPIKLTGVNIEATEPGYVTRNDGTGVYTFQGIYRPTPFPKEDWDKIRFVGTGNQLLKPSVENPDKPNESNPLKALRAYFKILPNAQTPTNAKDYTFEVDSFVPTSIANIQIEGDGDGAIYNIGGQRVEGKSLPKGIYIRDGKKFVVK